MDTSHVLLDLNLRCEGPPDQLAWCASSNLIAAACVSETPGVQPVCVLDPDSPKEHVILDVPLVDKDDKIMSLMWSPIGCPRVLLTVTVKGNCYVWSQSNGVDPLAVNVWYGAKAAYLGKAIACAKWMCPSPPWIWRPSKNRIRQPHMGGNWKVRPTNALDGQFFEHKNVPDGSFPWLRPGKLFIGLVTVDGDFVVLQKGFGSMCLDWLQLQTIPIGVIGDIRAADITGFKGKMVRIAVSCASAPGKLHILETEGDPAWKVENGAFKIKKAGELGFTGDCSIESATFEPCCGGRKLYVTMRAHGLDEVSLTGYTQIEDQQTWEESGSWLRCAPNIDDLSVQDWVEFAISPDGTWAAALSSRDKPTLLNVDNLSLVEELRTTATRSPEAIPTRATCAAFGPSGTALVVGAVCENSNCARVLLWVLGEHGSDVNWAATNADRVLWGFASRRHLWDTVQRVRVCDSRRGVCRGQKAVLSLLDDVIHAQPYHPRPAYAAMLDLVKARVLASWDDPVSKAVLIDLYSRSMVIFIYNSIANKSLKTVDFNSSEPHDVEDERHWVDWCWWLHRFTHFCSQCLRTWTGRCRSQDMGPKGEAASHVPFVRLLLDSYFVQRLIILSQTLPHLVKAHMTSDLQRDLLSFSEMVKRMHGIVKRQDISSRDDPAAATAAVEAVKSIMGGPFQLHYYRPEGMLNWQELRKLEVLSGFNQLRDEEIEISAAKLGLLPVSTPPPHRSPLEDLTKGYTHFRKSDRWKNMGSEDEEGVFGLKRKRWHLDRDISIGLLPSRWPSTIERHHEDSLSATTLPRNETPFHCAVDSSSVTNQFMCTRGAEPSGVQWAMARACMVAAPVTASRWKRMRHQ